MMRTTQLCGRTQVKAGKGCRTATPPGLVKETNYGVPDMRFSAFLAMVILSITNNWAAHAAQFESGGWYRVCSRAKLSRYNAHDGSFCALMHEIKNSDAPFFDLFLWGALAFIIQNEEYKVIGMFPLHMVTPMSLHGDGNDRVVLNAKACNQRGCYYFLSISKKLFYALSNSKALTLTLGLGRTKKGNCSTCNKYTQSCEDYRSHRNSTK